jgi:glycogen operon protein
VLRQPAFFEGRAVEDGDGCKDLAWFHPAGRELTEADWYDQGLRSIGMYLDGRGLRHRGRRGEMIIDESFLLLLHSGDEDGLFTVPGAPWAASYDIVVDTQHAGGAPDPAAKPIAGGAAVAMSGRSALLLQVNRNADASSH